MKNSIADELQGPKRLPNEDFDEYKDRLKWERKILKMYMQGEVIWSSGGRRAYAFLTQTKQFKKFPEQATQAFLNAQQGTYIKSKHGLLTAIREQ